MSGKLAARRTVDIGMTAAIILLLSSQITGQQVHEWTGIIMSALVIAHIIMNHVWYRNIFRGRYRASRIFQTCVNLALLICFAVTAVSGMLMSQYAVRFLRVSSLVGRAREMHLAFSHWSFVLISAHLGLHWNLMLRKIRGRKALWRALSVIAVIAAAYGLVLSVRAQIYDYMFFNVAFAFADKSKSAARVIFENILMMTSWAFISFEVSEAMKKGGTGAGRRRLISALMIAAQFALAGVFLHL